MKPSDGELRKIPVEEQNMCAINTQRRFGDAGAAH